MTNGFSTGVSFTSATIDNPNCGPSAGTNSGWLLKTLTRAAAGLPNTIALPLRLRLDASAAAAPYSGAAARCTERRAGGP